MSFDRSFMRHDGSPMDDYEIDSYVNYIHHEVLGNEVARKGLRSILAEDAEHAAIETITDVAGMLRKWGAERTVCVLMHSMSVSGADAIMATAVKLLLIDAQRLNRMEEINNGQLGRP